MPVYLRRYSISRINKALKKEKEEYEKSVSNSRSNNDKLAKPF